MCGIVGYIGSHEAVDVLLSGLRRMEYRGYDSAGVAVLENGHTRLLKRPGKIAHLQEALEEHSLPGQVGIGHTRWATHGEPNERNAHPHQAGPISLVHNGIIENYAELKAGLIKHHHVTFASDTDTEVLAQLIAVERKAADSLEAAVRAALRQVEGAFGIVVLSELDPHELVAARRGSPLILGVADGATYIASDATALVGHTDRVVYLDDDEIAVCEPGGYRVTDLDAQAKEHEEHVVELELSAIEKSGYDHFLLKEIMEQPKTIADTLRGRLNLAEGTSHLGGLNLPEDSFSGINRFLTVACGTAYYSGLLGKYYLERLTGLPVDVEIASEFRYREPVVAPGTVGIVVSQSGETADTLASLREMKRRGMHTLGLVNVVGSSVAREVDGGIYLHAGPEISVASTKAYTSQVLAQLLLGLAVARSRSLSVTQGQEIVQALEALPGYVQQVLDTHEQIKAVAHKYAKYEHAMYLGRDTLYPVALEGALKLKETAYLHADAYPAGELKHGAIALIDERMLVVFYHPKNALYDKARTNLEEIKARGGKVVVVGTQGDEAALREFSEDIITIPDCSPWVQPLVANIPMQLFAYYMATARGTDVDQPRNLAKSVTVE